MFGYWLNLRQRVLYPGQLHLTFMLGTLSVLDILVTCILHQTME